jgi:hypothetical protein
LNKAEGNLEAKSNIRGKKTVLNSRTNIVI